MRWTSPRRKGRQAGSLPSLSKSLASPFTRVHAIALRYGWQPSRCPSSCACGANFSVEHALSCPKGGFPIVRHNEIRDLTANLLTEVCHDVCVEPTLQPITGETFSNATANSDEGARLDVAASGFWGGRFERAFFDVRVFNPHAPSNRQPLPTCYRKHENIKKRAYEPRVREVEHGFFTPLVFSSTGGMGKAASACYKRLASLIAAKRDTLYSSTMSWIICRLSFSLLRSSIQCIRGACPLRHRSHSDTKYIDYCMYVRTCAQAIDDHVPIESI